MSDDSRRPSMAQGLCKDFDGAPEKLRHAQLQAFNEELSARLASLDRGETITAAEAWGRLAEKSRAHRARQA